MSTSTTLTLEVVHQPSLSDRSDHGERLYYQRNIYGRFRPDFTIISREGTEFPCHRFLLSSQSRVMRAMLRADMRESRTGVLLLNYPDKVVRKFTQFFYGGEVEDDHSLDNVCDYKELVNMYELRHFRLFQSRGSTFVSLSVIS